MLDNQQPSVRMGQGSQTMYEALSCFYKVINMTDFKTMCDELLVQYHNKQIRKNDITNRVSKAFGISTKTFRLRFKSIFKETLSDKCESLLIPPRDHVVLCMMKCDTVKELWDIIDIPTYYRKRVFQDNFGVSTFARAKALVLLESPKVSYDPSIEENRALVASQILGDGSYCKVRGSIRISHGEKQFEYAVYKAALFNKAFPTTKPAGNTKLFTHTQGHRYSSWYSGRLPSKLTTWISDTSLASMVEGLTPWGFMLWFLDDGYRSPDGVVSEMYIHDRDAAVAAVDYLGSYGIKASLSKGSVLSIKDMVNSVKFYKNFIEPFKETLPECVKYKTYMKI